MDLYRNTTGKSGVYSYELFPEAIIVRFINGTAYAYDWNTTGRNNVEKMKRLAKRGRGLHSFIMKQVYFKYATRLR